MNHTKLTSLEAVENELALEQLSVQMGINRYREALAEDGIGGLTPGKQLMKAALTPMVDALTGWLEATAAGLASRNAATFTALMDPTQMTTLTV